MQFKSTSRYTLCLHAQHIGLSRACEKGIPALQTVAVVSRHVLCYVVRKVPTTMRTPC